MIADAAGLEEMGCQCLGNPTAGIMRFILDLSYARGLSSQHVITGVACHLPR